MPDPGGWLDHAIGLISSVISGLIGYWIEKRLEAPKHLDAVGPVLAAGWGGAGFPLGAKGFLYPFAFMLFYVALFGLTGSRWAVDGLTAYLLFSGFVVLSLALASCKSLRIGRIRAKRARDRRHFEAMRAKTALASVAQDGAAASRSRSRSVGGDEDPGRPRDPDSGPRPRRHPRRAAEEALLESLPFCVLLLGLLALDAVLPRYVSLSIPESVGATEIVRGRVVDPGWNVFVLIQPVQSSEAGLYRADVDSKGDWSSISRFGGSAGTRFLVRAVAFEPYAMLLLGPSPRAASVAQTARLRSRSVGVVRGPTR